MRLNYVSTAFAGGSSMEKALNQRLFGVVVRYSRVKPKLPGSSPIQYLFFPSFFLFFRFFVIVCLFGLWFF